MKPTHAFLTLIAALTLAAPLFAEPIPAFTPGARVSNVTAFMYMGELVEIGPTEQMFTAPRDRRTDDYVTGRFG